MGSKGYISPVTPIPNNAKTYVTGSSGSNFRKFNVSSKAVRQPPPGRWMRHSLRATRSTCTSQGQINWCGLIFFQRPKSTPLWSFRTIHRRNIFNLLQAELRSGAGMCFMVRRGKSGRLKNLLLKLLRYFSTGSRPETGLDTGLETRVGTGEGISVKPAFSGSVKASSRLPYSE